MKKITLSCLSGLISLSVSAQSVNYLQENFNVACVTSTGMATHWMVYTPIPTTVPDGEWTCTPTEGRPSSTGSATPGMMCTSVYGTPPAYYLDTSYLISPLLNLSSYAPHSVYLHFDSKVSNILLGGKLHIIKAPAGDTTFQSLGDSDLTFGAAPVIGNSGDSSDWVTHEVDLTVLEGEGNFYIGFRYTGTTATGSIWYIDNVNTSTTRLYTPNVTPNRLPLTVVGQSTYSQIVISYSSPDASSYQLGIYDMFGREVHKEMLNARGGFETYTIGGLDLTPGMYFLKMGNGKNFNATKVVVR